jgi:hypothetical protein
MKISTISILLFVMASSCQSALPVVLVASPEIKERIDCEMAFYKKKENSSIEEFKAVYIRKVVKRAKQCNCDTVFIDISTAIWGLEEDFVLGGCIKE